MSELFATPNLEVRWAKMVGDAEPNKFDPAKPDTWSIEALLDSKNPDHMAWVETAEKHFTDAHGDNAKKNAHWLAIGPDKDDRMKMVAKFKLPCFTRKDGTKSPGPTVMDANKQPWRGALIGNGSICRIGYTVYAWQGPSGCGITMQPTHLQVLDLVEYSANAAPSADPFEVVSTGYKQPEADVNCPMPEAKVVVTEAEACPF